MIHVNDREAAIKAIVSDPDCDALWPTPGYEQSSLDLIRRHLPYMDADEPHVTATPGTVPQYTVGFLFQGPNVSLVRKARPDWQRGRYNGVGGRVKQCETPRQCMAREFEEEALVAVPAQAWKHRVVLRTAHSVIHFFACDGHFASPVALNPSAEEPVDWFNVAFGLPVKLIGNLRWLIPLCRDWQLRGPVYIAEDGDDGHRDTRPEETLEVPSVG